MTTLKVIHRFNIKEHILEYPPGTRGLYLHGINENKAVLSSWSSDRVRDVAKEFGFMNVAFKSFMGVDEVRDFTDECRVSGSFEDRAIEGWVVRGRLKSDATNHFFKVKYDEPYCESLD
jgi:tRNA ligase